MERPVSVTVVCWVIIALAIEAVIGLLSGFAEASLKDMFHALGSPLSFSTSVISGVVVSAATMVFAALMLRGANWARIVYLCILGFTFLSLAIMHSRVPAALLFLAAAKSVVFGTLLLRPAANQYFDRSHAAVTNDVAPPEVALQTSVQGDLPNRLSR
jgi:hypothetical protein